MKKALTIASFLLIGCFSIAVIGNSALSTFAESGQRYEDTGGRSGDREYLEINFAMPQEQAQEEWDYVLPGEDETEEDRGARQPGAGENAAEDQGQRQSTGEEDPLYPEIAMPDYGAREEPVENSRLSREEMEAQLFGQETSQQEQGETLPILPPPQNPHIMQVEGKLILRWDPVEQAGAYAVYGRLDTSAEWIEFADTQATEFTQDLSGFEQTSFTLEFCVASRSEGGESEKSQVVSAHVDKGSNQISPPGRPSGLTIRTGERKGSVRLSWNEVSGADGYYVYQSKTLDGGYARVGETTAAQLEQTGLEADRTYYYRVAAYNATGYGEMSDTVKIELEPEKDPLKAPKNLSVETLNNKSATLTWSRVPQADGYLVYRWSEKNDTREIVVDTGATRYVDKNLRADTYYYAVAAYRDGEESDETDEVSVDLEVVVIEAPQALQATAVSGTSIRLTWLPGEDVDGYWVYRAYSRNGQYEKLTFTEDTEYIDIDLEPGVTCYYMVSARKNGSESVRSGIAKATTTTKSVQVQVEMESESEDEDRQLVAPMYFTLTAIASDAVQIKVSEAPDNHNNGFYVYCSQASGVGFKQVEADSQGIVRGLMPDTDYYFKIRPYMGGAMGEYSSEGLVRTLPAETNDEVVLLKKPAGVIARALDQTRIQLGWKPVDQADFYNIYRAEASNGEYKLVGSSYELTMVDNNLAPETTYYYQVEAQSGNVAGPRSNIVLAKTKALSVSSNLEAEPLSFSSIRLTWKYSKSADEFRIFRATDKAGDYLLVDTVDQMEFVDVNLLGGAVYFYKVEAISGSAVTMIGLVSSQTPSFDAPVVTTLTVSSSSIQVSWDKVEGADGYIIYRADAIDGKYTQIAKGNTVSYVDKYLDPSTVYYYKVKAYHSVSGVEAVSGAASGTTEAKRAIGGLFGGLFS